MHTVQVAKYDERHIRSLPRKKQAAAERAVKPVTQLADEILKAAAQGVTVRCPELPGKMRFKLRQHLPTPCNARADYGVFVESRGRPPNKTLLVWRKADVADTLKRILPGDIVDVEILPRVCAMVRAETQAIQQAKQQKDVRDTRVYRCDGCGCRGTANEILVSVHHPGKFCDDCIEADEDMSGSKWEDVPYYNRWA